MLKKGDWHESVREPVINCGHDRSGRPGKKRDHEWNEDLLDVWEDTPKSILRKSTNMQRSIQRLKFTKAVALETKIFRSNPKP